MSCRMVLRALEQGPATVDDLVYRTAASPAEIRSSLALLIFVERQVACDRIGMFFLGEPSKTVFPAVKRHT